jgi:hypothetical protein
MRKLNLFFVAAIICSFAFLVYTAEAAASKPHRGAASPSLLAVSPSAPSVGNAVAFSGCDYASGSSVTIIVYSPGAAAFFGAATDSSGCFDTAATESYTADEAGGYEVDAYQSQQLIATIHFTVS